MDSRDKFAQMLREGYETLDPEKEQREYIMGLLRQKEQRRKRRIKTITAVAAAFLIVVGAVLAVGGCFGAVEADKNDRTKVEEKDGRVLISDENADGQEVMPETAMTTEWDKIDKLKEKYPEMITFTDVPEGMEFVSVEVKEENFDMIIATYSYRENGNVIYVSQKYYLNEKEETKGVDGYDEKIKHKNKIIYLFKENNNLMGKLEMGNGEIDIIGATQKEEIFNIVEQIKEAS